MDFSKIENMPNTWALAAYQLNKSGDLIFDAYLADLVAFEKGQQPSWSDNLAISVVATMLYGLAIENLLKASIIAKTGEKPSSWPGNGHNQEKLSEMLDNVFSDSEKDLFIRFTAFVNWAGKYKVPLREEELYSTKQVHVIKGNSLPIPLSRQERDDIYKPLYKKLFDPILQLK